MAIISISGLSKSFSARPLFTNISFALEAGERVGLIGPNGAGKSTLLSILSGKQTADAGDVAVQRGLKIAHVAQIPLFKKNATILSTLLEHVHDTHHAENLAKAYELISKFSLEDAETSIAKLSGGWQKRVALARELMRDPDLLLLDEPTNHLDVESILWLEDFLSKANFATVTITHDRFFLRKVSTRILELDKRNPGGLLSVKGNYENYLEAKQNLMNAQEKMETTLKNTLRRETEWLRAGVKARTTKQYARIERAHELAEQVSDLEYRNTKKNVELEFVAEGHNPKKLIEAKNILKAYGEGKVLFQHLNLLISPGSRLGLLGRNGCGKSTLIRVLLAQEKQDKGSVFISDKVKVAYFEQNRESLNPEITLAKTLSPAGDQVIYRGKPVHVRGYLDRFLFTSLQMNMPVSQLSGGEQSRLLLAKLMLEDANVLVLDEPTNDLDLATMTVLEDCLSDFDGAVILVTHDRYFLERVTTRILAFHPVHAGQTEFFASLAQWEAWHEQELRAEQIKIKNENKVMQQNAKSKPVKLSYKEERELGLMETTIQQAEAQLESLMAQSELPENMSNSQMLVELTEGMGQVQVEIENLYARWQELEKKKQEFEP